MKRVVLGIIILALGALVLSPAIAAMGFDPVPGDFVLVTGNLKVNVPVIYSLCASGGIALLYYFLKR
jgi:hypothetical protein